MAKNKVAQATTGWYTVKSRSRFMQEKIGPPVKVMWPREALGEAGNIYYREGEKKGAYCVFPDGSRVELPPRDFIAWRGDPKLIDRCAE